MIRDLSLFYRAGHNQLSIRLEPLHFELMQESRTENLKSTLARFEEIPVVASTLFMKLDVVVKHKAESIIIESNQNSLSKVRNCAGLFQLFSTPIHSP